MRIGIEKDPFGSRPIFCKFKSDIATHYIYGYYITIFGRTLYLEYRIAQ